MKIIQKNVFGTPAKIVLAGNDRFLDIAQRTLAESEIDTIQFKTWQTTDRATLKTEIISTDEFMDEFKVKLGNLKIHDFISKQQSTFFNFKKENLKAGEILVTCDFSENYAFIIQEAAQSFHWNNNTSCCYLFFKSRKLNRT